jgi:DNA-binding FadR family transcriptional regulator
MSTLAINDNAGTSALAQLRAYLARTELALHSRLPPERRLCEALGVSRAELRKALAVLESEGQIWRHVGKGTFVGGRPLDALADIAAVTRSTNPAEVMQARLLIEPEVARFAALNARAAQIGEMRLCLQRSRAAETWRQYESWDNRLHRTIGEATQNSLVLALLDTLSAVRRAVTWGRLRAERVRPAPSHHSFAEHQEIVDAIEDRDMERACAAMRTHLESVQRNLMRQG